MPDDIEAEIGSYVASELEKILDFMRISRKYGITVTATPSGVALIEKSGDPAKHEILNNLCKVDKDPWAAH